MSKQGEKELSEQSNKRENRAVALVVFSMCVLIYFIINIQRVAVPGQLFDMLQRELAVSASAVSALGTAFMYVFATAQLFAGLFVDKYGGVRTITVGGILLCIGAFIFPLEKSFVLMVAARLLVGLGCSTVILSLVKECDRLFPKAFTMVWGVVILIGLSGAAIGTAPLAIGAKLWGWRTCMMVVAAVGAVGVLGIIVCWPFTWKPQVMPGKLSLRPLIEAFKIRENIIQFLAFTVNYGLYFCILTIFGNKFLVDIGGLSENLASSTGAIMMLLPAVSNLLSGCLTAWCGNRRRPFFIMMNVFPLISTTVVMASLLLNLPAKGHLLMAALIAVSLVAGGSPIASALARETNPPEYTGTAVGIINFGAYIMTAIFGTLSGLILDTFGGVKTADGSMLYPLKAYITIFSIFFVISVFTFVVSLKMPETHGKNIYHKP
ncbi:MAG: MFS transporter [Victivallales bacterium]|nr:MFS transporter [Victivallales bacterium]